VVAVCAGLFACIALFSYLPLLVPAFTEYSAALIAAASIYLPSLVLWRRGETLAGVGVALPRSLRHSVTPWVALIIFPPFAVGFFAYHNLLYGSSVCIDARCLAGLPEDLLIQSVLIALPEEIFYRGYVQSRLQRLLPRRVVVLGGDVGPAVLLTSLVFAASHMIAIPSPSRLAVFFPSVLFGWLRDRTGSVAGPIVLHALSNVVLAVLYRGLC